VSEVKVKQSNNSPPFKLRGVGPQTASHLARLDIHSVRDLLLHLPVRYQDRTKIQPMRLLRAGQEAVVEGVVRSVERPLRGRTKVFIELCDDSGFIMLRFFHVLSFQKQAMYPGTRLRCYGDVRFGPKGFEMTHPEFKIIDDEHAHVVDPHLTPIYPATDGLSQHMLRKLTGNALAVMREQDGFKELLPEEVMRSVSLPSLQASIAFVHRPPREIPIPLLMENQTPQQQRLVFEELLAHRLSLLRIKEAFQSHRAESLPPHAEWREKFLSTLSFQLTNAQRRVVDEISVDLSRDKPMLRLVQGDVGSGKTVVAALAMLQAMANGYQTVMMAPTELLAEQHYRNFKKWLEPLGLQVVCLTGSIKGKARVAALDIIKSGAAHIVLGTHALFQDGVEFSKLALVIIDEQHRFGVQQRALLRDKGAQDDVHPHQLIMTATPIPRTLSMSFYADIDMSVIDELPPGRTPITTTVLLNSRRDEVIVRVKEACEQGRQVYWVCPLIEESEELDCQAATTAAEELQAKLPRLKVSLIHGRMKPQEKETIMRSFQQGETHLLVATTVIEVGVDVPNASVMVIENAERLGLSQLHQLRGRVGRGSAASHCVLLYQQPLSKLAKERLSVMRETTDGFKIAQRDLELRGPGEVLGTKQTGDLSFHVADLLRDSALLPKVQQAAEQIVTQYKDHIEPLIHRWLADKADYAKV
jgi:ATP-dependent DNA helicase RecG